MVFLLGENELTDIIIEFGDYINNLDITSIVVTKKKKYKNPKRDRSCEHLSSKYKCRICTPSVLCKHGTVKYNCLDCTCIHRRVRCKVCSECS